MCGLQSLLAWSLQVLNFLLANFRQQFQNLKLISLWGSNHNLFKQHYNKIHVIHWF